MDLASLIRLNLLSPMILSFVLGIVAVRVKSDLKIPEQVYSIISIYLLFAIGLKGGFDLARTPLSNFWGAAAAAAILGALIPIWSYFILKRFLDTPDAVSLGLHYGAVSAVTLSTCITFLNEAGQTFEGFMPTMYVIMEIPAVFVSLLIANRVLGSTKQGLPKVLKSAVAGKSFLLLGGGVLIGYVSGEPGYNQVAPFFVDLFSGFLTLFLLEMGTQVGRKLRELLEVGIPLLIFSIVMPLFHGVLGAVFGTLVGLSIGGTMILATLAASASYITAPAVVTSNLKEANVSLALTASLVLTFPFNIMIGLPIYFELSRWVANLL